MQVSSLSSAATLPRWRSPCQTGKRLRINDVGKNKVCRRSLAEQEFHAAEKFWTGAKKRLGDSYESRPYFAFKGPHTGDDLLQTEEKRPKRQHAIEAHRRGRVRVAQVLQSPVDVL